MSPDSIWPEASKGFCDFHQNLLLVHGQPKVGKTTFFSKFPGALYLTTEDGTKHLSVHEWRIRKWTDFTTRLKTLQDNIANCPYQTIVIDTVANLADMCEEFVANKIGVPTIADAEFGKGYAAYSREFKKQVNALVKLGLGVAFIAHSEDKIVSADSVVNPYAPMMANEKGELTMIVPALDKRTRKFISGLADMIFYVEIDKNLKRVIRTQPSKHFEAGDRSGRLPDTLSLNYEAVLDAYYGGNDGDKKAKTALVERINKAEQYMSEKEIDNFNVPKRAMQSRKKHLGVEKIDEATIDKLEGYLQHLRIKAKKHNGGK